LTQPFQLESPGSRNVPSYQRQPSYFHDEDAGDAHWRPVPQGGSHGPGVPRQSPSSRTSTTSPAQLPRNRTTTVTKSGSINSGAGPHRAGSLNTDSSHDRSSSTTFHGDTEHPPTHKRVRISSNVASLERQTSTSASASPNSLSPVQFPHRSNVSDIGSTTSRADLRAGSWNPDRYRNKRVASGSDTEREDSLNGHRDFRDLDDIGQLDDLQSMRSTELEQRAIWLEAEAKRTRAKVKKREAEVKKHEAEVKKHEAEVKKREAEVKKREAEVKKREAKVQMREAEVQTREEGVQRREEEVRLREGEARRLEERARRSLADAERLEAEHFCQYTQCGGAEERS